MPSGKQPEYRRAAQWAAAFVLLSTLGACDTFESAQFQVHRPPTDATARFQVASALAIAAASAGLVDQTTTSTVGDTVAYFLEPVDHFPTMLGARGIGESIVIDLSCFHPGWQASKPFAAARDSLLQSLPTAFGSDWQLVTKREDMVPLSQPRGTAR